MSEHNDHGPLSPIDRLFSLRMHQTDGKRSPHKPLLVLLALSQLATSGNSALSWLDVEKRLPDLLAEYGPPSRTSRPQSAAYPFTRLRSDLVWHLDRDVPMDNVGPLREAPITGRLEPALEATLLAEPATLAAVARSLVEAHFPDTIARDVLLDVGLDPEMIYGTAQMRLVAAPRQRSASWRATVIEAWDRQCAFCGYDGLLAGASVGIEAAHVRWFNHDGPDELDNGLALCSLHHTLLDRGVLGFTAEITIVVSASFTARTEAGRLVYDLHGRPVGARPGTPLPAARHVAWHTHEVFKGQPLSA